MIHLVIVSDIRIYREGLEDVVSSKSEVKVVGTASSIEHAIRVIHDITPDVALIDMTMISSFDAIDHITSSCPGTSIIALAVSEDEDSILACAKAGITGYVSREASIEQLINTVCAAVEGELYCSRRITAILLNKLKSLSNANDISPKKSSLQPDYVKISLLTQREKQIAALLSEGFSNKKIAQQLTIEVSTVKNHVHNMFAKIGVHSRLQAVQVLQHQITTD